MDKASFDLNMMLLKSVLNGIQHDAPNNEQINLFVNRLNDIVSLARDEFSWANEDVQCDWEA
jgi:hypothetical protein